MLRTAEAIGYVAAGVLAGVVSAYAVISSSGVDPIQSGSPWLSRAAGLSGSDSYYVRSHYLMEGRLPPAPGQMTEATAETDESGQTLRSACRYRLTAEGPLPRWWSLAVTEPGGDGQLRQSAVDSDSVVREADGKAVIVASLSPASGNWLKIPNTRNITLLYSALPAGARSQMAKPPFRIAREGC